MARNKYGNPEIWTSEEWRARLADFVALSTAVTAAVAGKRRGRDELATIYTAAEAISAASARALFICSGGTPSPHGQTEGV